MEENCDVAFRIVIDTREQEPYAFGCPTARRKLDAGDYSVVGHEDAVAVERKSLADFAQTVIRDFARFDLELRSLAEYKAACVVVEADLDDVLRGRARRHLRSVSPASVLGASAHITLRYGVPVFWCGSRQAACAFTEQYLRGLVRHVVPDEPTRGCHG